MKEGKGKEGKRTQVASGGDNGANQQMLLNEHTRLRRRVMRLMRSVTEANVDYSSACRTSTWRVREGETVGEGAGAAVVGGEGKHGGDGGGGAAAGGGAGKKEGGDGGGGVPPTFACEVSLEGASCCSLEYMVRLLQSILVFLLNIQNSVYF